jgi:hypothetical protein
VSLDPFAYAQAEIVGWAACVSAAVDVITRLAAAGSKLAEEIAFK